MSTVAFLSFRDAEPFLAAAAVRAGLPAHAVATKLAVAVEGGDSGALFRLLGSMPIQGAFCDLRTRAHSQSAFRFTPSDCVDFLSLASVAPCVDAIVVDRKTFNLARGRIATRNASLGVFRRLADLARALDLPG